jgi:hypothetical protein
MRVKTTIIPNWDGKIHKNMQAALLDMAADIDKRAKILAPKLTRALVNSALISPSKLSDTYTVSFGSSKVPYARRRHYENKKNPQTIGYLTKAGESVARGSTGKYFRGVDKI